jgi:hypothetical protein
VADGEVLALAQDMTISRESFLRSLPAALHCPEVRSDGDQVRPVGGDAGWRIVVTPLPELRLGSIALPRQRIEIHLTGYDETRTRALLERFELYFRHAGG